jgi:hypothetical protein
MATWLPATGLKHSNRADMKIKRRASLFTKIGYDLPNSPPQHLFPYRSILEILKDGSICLLHFRQRLARVGADVGVTVRHVDFLSPHPRTP